MKLRSDTQPFGRRCFGFSVSWSRAFEGFCKQARKATIRGSESFMQPGRLSGFMCLANEIPFICSSMKGGLGSPCIEDSTRQMKLRSDTRPLGRSDVTNRIFCFVEQNIRRREN
ncbi:hypothetical protein CEXT_80831 [Caerostris extrusa]|uniref:Uncharacterized protein n=1 Tax=Caerostris extrusa TaxID=172846 RepID=A0AAV4N910_CAEEX|nr:hypothetical protein CEXT_80831 [Caerostris extrusa]